MRRLASISTATAFLLASCSTTAPERAPFTVPPTESSTTTTSAPPAVAADAVDRLVVVGSDGSVVTMLPDGRDVVTIVAATGDTLVLQPQWAPRTNKLAWGEAGPGGFSLTISDADGSNRTATRTAGLPYFLFWAPDGERLVGLYDGAEGGVEARYVEVAGGSTVIGTGSPYFFSWNPSSSHVAAHIGTTSLDIVDLDGSSESLAEASPFYQAPVWTRTGIIHLTEAGIALDDGAGGSRLLATVPGPVLMAADAEGGRLAVQPFGPQDEPAGTSVAFQQVPELVPNVVSIVDTTTGRVQVASAERAFALFWSPDGSALAILEETTTGGELGWVLWQDGKRTQLASFAPLASFVQQVLQFAPQYALSLNLWAPDARALAFVGEIDGRQGVWVQRTDGSDPEFVADGTWVAWSHG